MFHAGSFWTQKAHAISNQASDDLYRTRPCTPVFSLTNMSLTISGHALIASGKHYPRHRTLSKSTSSFFVQGISIVFDVFVAEQRTHLYSGTLPTHPPLQPARTDTPSLANISSLDVDLARTDTPSLATSSSMDVDSAPMDAPSSPTWSMENDLPLMNAPSPPMSWRMDNDFSPTPSTSWSIENDSAPTTVTSKL